MRGDDCDCSNLDVKLKTSNHQPKPVEPFVSTAFEIPPNLFRSNASAGRCNSVVVTTLANELKVISRKRKFDHACSNHDVCSRNQSIAGDLRREPSIQTDAKSQLDQISNAHKRNSVNNPKSSSFAKTKNITKSKAVAKQLNAVQHRVIDCSVPNPRLLLSHDLVVKKQRKNENSIRIKRRKTKRKSSEITGECFATVFTEQNSQCDKEIVASQKSIFANKIEAE